MDAEDQVFKLSESVDIKQANQLYCQLTERIQENDVLIIDSSQVQQIDAAGLQLLLACQLECSRQNKTFQLVNTPPSITLLFKSLGVSFDLIQNEGVH